MPSIPQHRETATVERSEKIFLNGLKLICNHNFWLGVTEGNHDKVIEDDRCTNRNA
jgi:hypothetical protein